MTATIKTAKTDKVVSQSVAAKDREARAAEKKAQDALLAQHAAILTPLYAVTDGKYTDRARAIHAAVYVDHVSTRDLSARIALDVAKRGVKDTDVKRNRLAGQRVGKSSAPSKDVLNRLANTWQLAVELDVTGKTEAVRQIERVMSYLPILAVRENLLTYAPGEGEAGDPGAVIDAAEYLISEEQGKRAEAAAAKREKAAAAKKAADEAAKSGDAGAGDLNPEDVETAIKSAGVIARELEDLILRTWSPEEAGELVEVSARFARAMSTIAKRNPTRAVV